jgi:hypothetical protein
MNKDKSEPQSQQGIIEGWEERLGKEDIWMVFDGRQDEPVAYKQDVVNFIKALLQAQREKDALICEKTIQEERYSGAPYALNKAQALILNQNNKNETNRI